MELKLHRSCRVLAPVSGLNRTFYGIETHLCNLLGTDRGCLNRTFYGIETWIHNLLQQAGRGLNRTFYGIETMR